MTTSDWTDYFEHGTKQKVYQCSKCRSFGGRMKCREVKEVSGDNHREYRIVCENCEYKGSVHLSKILAEKTWEAEGDKYYE